VLYCCTGAGRPMQLPHGHVMDNQSSSKPPLPPHLTCALEVLRLALTLVPSKNLATLLQNALSPAPCVFAVARTFRRCSQKGTNFRSFP
jgi:hypothetical protein